MTAGLARSASEEAALARMEDGAGLSPLAGRLSALSRVVDIATARNRSGGFGGPLLDDAHELLGRAGERLRLSGDHTVVVMAGGTGSGKSSLFNQLAGADFSPVGMTRPVTRAPHACVWGMSGAGPLLDWIGVAPRYRYARSSALDDGERGLAGLLLLDLPDHDSVLADSSHEISRLISVADLLVWVLDPQKYADASVHSRFLVPMAGHSSVMAVVLNQVDRLGPDQVADCESDLQRLLDAEGLHDTAILATSAVTGQGVSDLRGLLMDAVIARQSASARIGADLDAITERLAAHAGDESVSVPEASEAALVEECARATGVAGVCRTLQSVRELRAADHVGWPVSWLGGRALRRDPARRMRLGSLWDELRGVTAGPADAQVAEIDNAITALGDTVAAGLPEPWPASIRDAARSRIDDVAPALGEAVARSLPEDERAVPWWRLAAAWQGLLLGGAVIGAVWLVALLAMAALGVTSGAPAILVQAGFLPWAAGLTAVSAALGWLSSLAFMRLVVRGAGRERERVQAQMRARVAEVSARLVLEPVRSELAEYEAFREQLAVARQAG